MLDVGRSMLLNSGAIRRCGCRPISEQSRLSLSGALVCQHLIHDLLRRLAGEQSAGERIVRLTNGGEKNSQVIVYLSRGRDGRPWIGAGATLLDRDGGRQSFDEIDIRLFHLIEELPRVRGEALDVTPLALRIKSVESQRGFPRAA